MSFNRFLTEQQEYETLMEKLITFGGRAYPKFGNIVILAGGAGSGKGFVKDKLLGIEGYTFDVDALKMLAANADGIAKTAKDKYGIDMKSLSQNMKDPQNVYDLHIAVADYLNLPNKRQAALFTSILLGDETRKPNLIFDVTLKDLGKLEKISKNVSAIGYDKKNIHIVWVVNDVKVAIAQNRNRSRTVPEDILMNTHRGVSQTMRQIFDMGDKLSQYMDGEFVLAFNKAGVDGEYVTSEAVDMYRGKPGQKGGYFKAADYVFVKRAGKRITSYAELAQRIIQKIAKYVPDALNWD